MANYNEFVTNIFYVGVNDRTKHQFEGLWPLPLGVSYNSYLIVDEKIALIDTIDQCHGEIYLSKIKNTIGDRMIDYLIINHMEPDHSSAIRFIQQHYPEIEIIGNKTTLSMIDGFYGRCGKYKEIKEGDTLPLGNKQLRFYMTPMIHWPETMMTYSETDQLLFSGDGFGCFGALNGAIVDEQMNTDCYWDEMYRYYSNIVGKYGSPVQKALSKLSGLPIRYICSTHGPVWHKEVKKVTGIYDALSKYEGENGVVIAYGSMYGNTEQMAEAIAASLAARGVKNIVMHNVSKTDVSFILSDIFKYKGLIIGSPTYTNELFPGVESLLSKIENRDMKNRYLGCFGSYSWAGTAIKRLNAFAEKTKFEVVGEPVEMKLGITPDIAGQCDRLAAAMAQRLK